MRSAAVIFTVSSMQFLTSLANETTKKTEIDGILDLTNDLQSFTTDHQI